MPGIVGFTHGTVADGEAEQTLANMQTLLTHHPFYVRDPLYSDRMVCCTRTGIRPKGEPLQPCETDDLVVWLEGEFYNQDELQVADCRTDTEALARLYQTDNTLDFLRDIDGYYCAVIYDKARAKVHLISDRHGLKHLYWTKHRDGLAWGSEYKAMLALPGFQPRIDPQAVEDFFGIDYLTDNRTWFEGVQILEDAHVLTWDLTSGTMQQHRYWSWDDVPYMSQPPPSEELTEQLGSLFVDSVRRRVRSGERVGVLLSGGLDSRWIFAAMPAECEPIAAATFGRTGCDDVTIARQVARLRNTRHAVYEISSTNWFRPRLDHVWYSDGQDNLYHLHGVEFLDQMRQAWDVCLDGYLGDATIGGSYLHRAKGRNEHWLVRNRGRRYIIVGDRQLETQFSIRLPFFANRFLELAMSVPPSMREKSRLYNQVLLRTHPQYYRGIRWQNTGSPISWPEPLVRLRGLGRRIRRKLRSTLSKTRLELRDRQGLADYGRWIRQEPAWSCLARILTDRDALYPQYVKREQVQQLLDLQAKGVNRAERLCLYATFEIWLRQVFKHQYLPQAER